MRFKCALGAAVAILIAGCEGESASGAGPAPAGPRVGFLMETYSVDRWKRDEELFTRKAGALGAVVWSRVANGDQNRQNEQAENLLTMGAQVLVVVAKEQKAAGRIIESAHAKRVPVVAYDRLIRECDLDLYVTFDNEKVGALQAEGVLAAVPEGNFILLGGAASDNNSKLLRAGQLRAIEAHEKKTGKKIVVLDDPFLDNWDREEARRRVGNMLTRFKAEGKDVHAIIASNDSTAGGAVAALEAAGLAGKVAVSGQDADLSACQRIVEGTQTVTVYKPVARLADAAAEMAVRLARGESPADAARAMNLPLHELDNGAKKVPSIYLEPIFVTRENMARTVIADGWQPLEKVYSRVPSDQWPKQP
jgi:D-xylose transport system substrate-binding protein